MDGSSKLGLGPALMATDGQPPDIAKLQRELQELDERRTRLDRLITDALNRQRFSPDLADVDKARADEQAYLSEMDRLMTRIRAVEGKLLLLRKRGYH